MQTRIDRATTALHALWQCFTASLSRYSDHLIAVAAPVIVFAGFFIEPVIPSDEGPYYNLALLTHYVFYPFLTLAVCFAAFFSPHRSDPHRLVLYAAAGTVVIGLGSHAIAHFGPTIEQTVREEPYRALVMSALLLVLAKVVSTCSLRGLLSQRRSDPHESISLAQGHPVVGMSMHDTPTWPDRVRTAWHEAGHLLTIAALRGRDEGVHVAAYVDVNARGWVECPIPADNNIETDWLVWYLLLLRAGRVAERQTIALADAPRSLDDTRRWEHWARHYLHGGAYGYVYFDPANAAEEAANRNALETLARDQDELLDRFFNMNIELLDHAAYLLKMHGTVPDNQIPELLANVALPDDMPQPSLANTTTTDTGSRWPRRTTRIESAIGTVARDCNRSHSP